MTVQINPNNITITCVGEVPAKHFVGIDKQLAAKGGPVWGVAVTPGTDEPITVTWSGVQTVLSDATISFGDEIQVSATGCAQLFSTGKAVGRAMSNAAAGEDLVMMVYGK